MTRRNRLSRGDPPAQLGPLGHAQPVGVADQRGELAGHNLAQRGVALRLVGVVADHEPLIGGDLDLFDLQVVPNVAVAALPGQIGSGLRRSGPEPLTDDVVPVPVRVTAMPITTWGRSSRESFDLP